jgi:hypothetical protein
LGLIYAKREVKTREVEEEEDEASLWYLVSTKQERLKLELEQQKKLQLDGRLLLGGERLSRFPREMKVG